MEMGNNEMLSRVAFGTGRWEGRIMHNWVYLEKKNKWAKSYCHSGIKPSCDFYLQDGSYMLFSFHGYTNSDGVVFEIMKITVKNGKVTYNEDIVRANLLLKQYKQMISDPSCPDLLKDFLKGMPPKNYSLSGNAPDNKTYTTTIDDIRNYIENYNSKSEKNV